VTVLQLCLLLYVILTIAPLPLLSLSLSLSFSFFLTDGQEVPEEPAFRQEAQQAVQEQGQVLRVNAIRCVHSKKKDEQTTITTHNFH
jgi:hypothetical protein